MSDRQRFLSSTGAAIFSQVWRVGVTFGVQLILKRIIAPGDWGLWEWALPIFMILGAVRDLGLVFHVIRVEPRPYGNLLALELVWGSILVFFTFVAAPLLATGYSEPHPEILGVLQAMALFLFFEGLSTVPRVYFEGELQIGRAVAPELVRNLVMAVTSVSLAFAGFGVWALVIGHIGSVAVYAAFLWLKAYRDIPLHFERGATRQLLTDSLPLAAIWFLIILVRHIDPLILGARFPGAVVGNYKFAYDNAFRVSEIIMPAVGRALYPALVAFRSEMRRLFDAYALATLFILAIEVPAALLLFLNAEIVLLILGGEQWVEAPTYLRILCLAPLIDPFSRLGGEILKVHHRDREWIVCNLITLTTFLVGGIVLTSRLGPVGMAWINLVPLGGLLMTRLIYQFAPQMFLSLLRKLVFVYLLPIPFFGAAAFLAGEDLWLRFWLSLLASAISVILLGLRYREDFVRFFRRQDT